MSGESSIKDAKSKGKGAKRINRANHDAVVSGVVAQHCKTLNKALIQKQLFVVRNVVMQDNWTDVSHCSNHSIVVVVSVDHHNEEVASQQFNCAMALGGHHTRLAVEIVVAVADWWKTATGGANWCGLRC